MRKDLRSLVLAAALSAVWLGAAVLPAAGQSCGTGNPNCIAPTPPAGDNSNRIATTAFVVGAAALPPLPNGQIFVGNVSNVATGVAMSGTVSITNTGVTSLSLLNGRIYIGNASNVGIGVAMSGTVAITNAGVTSLVLPNGQIYVGNASNIGTAVAMSGAVSITNAGVTALTSSAFANPSAALGLAAVNGVAVTAMRSDAAPALSQSIVPTWSALHTFNVSPLVPTATFGDNTTKAASTAFVQAAVAAVGGATGANPTATIGLTAVNGVVTTFLRSDGAPALSQAIIPTWTQLHTFSANLNTPQIAGGTTNASILTIRSTTGGSATDAIAIRTAGGLSYAPTMNAGAIGFNPWEFRTGSANYSSASKWFFTVGTPNTTDTLYNCATPLTIPAQPLNQDTSFSICGSYSANATSSTNYSNMVTITSYVYGANLDINALVGTVIATQNGTGGAGVVGVGKALTAGAVAHAMELGVVCHAPGVDCTQTRGILMSFGGGNGGLANHSAFDIVSYDNLNRPYYGIMFDSNVSGGISTMQPSGTMIGAIGSNHVAFNGVDFSAVAFQPGGCAFKSTGFCVDPAGNVTAASLSGPSALTVGTTVVASATAGKILTTGGGVLAECGNCTVAVVTATTGFVSPYWQGGATASSVSEYRITSGNDTGLNSYLKITGGNNGTTTLAQFAFAGGNYGGLWMRNAAPSGGNYAILVDVTGTDKNSYYNTLATGGHVFQVNAGIVASILASGSIQMIKASTSTGATITVTAPGALNLGLFVGCGTTAGTAALYAGAGTSTTAKRILDDIGSGVTGC